jgi:hypothetical protein
MKKLCLKIAVAMIASIGLFATSASAANRTVNCDEGQSIQDALDKGKGSAAELYIDVSGSCEEVVIIKRDDVTIDGGGTAIVIGAIFVDGGNRIIVREITITGPGPGPIAGAVGGNLKLIKVAITGNPDLGGLAADSAYVGISKSTIENNGNGVLARQGSSVFIRESSISGNEDYGIILKSNSTGTVVSNSTISGNHIGIGVFENSSVYVDDSDIVNNYNTGIETDNGVSVDVDNNSTIGSNAEGGINANLHSSVVIGDSSITNNGNYGIKLQSDSGVRIEHNAIISGNGVAGEFCNNVESCGVFCGDTESSVFDEGQIADEVECTDFNQVAPTP